MARKTAAAVLDLPVNWGNVNVGDETVKLSVSVDRKNLSLTKADAHLCSKRLVADISFAAGNDNPDQPSAFEAGETISAAFDTHSFGVKTKTITFGLTAKKNSVHLEKLGLFAKRAGRIVVTDFGDIPEDAAEGGDEE